MRRPPDPPGLLQAPHPLARWDSKREMGLGKEAFTHARRTRHRRKPRLGRETARRAAQRPHQPLLLDQHARDTGQHRGGSGAAMPWRTVAPRQSGRPPARRDGHAHRRPTVPWRVQGRGQADTHSCDQLGSGALTPGHPLKGLGLQPRVGLGGGGIRVGSRSSSIPKRHRSAAFVDDVWWIATAILPYATTRRSRRFTAIVAGGRVRALRLWIGAAGDE